MRLATGDGGHGNKRHGLLMRVQAWRWTTGAWPIVRRAVDGYELVGHAVASDSSSQDASTVARTRLWYSFRFSR